jgi:hypothetical protein
LRILTDRTALLQAVDRLDARGGFADALGKAALLADNENLKRLINAFPEFFEGQASLRLVK